MIEAGFAKLPPLAAWCLALALAGVALANDPPDPALELYYSANATYNRQLYSVAASQYTDFLKRYGQHEKAGLARYGLGLSQFAMKRHNEAGVQFEQLLKEPRLDNAIDRGKLTLLHAQCLISTGRGDEALQRLIEASEKLGNPAQRNAAMTAVIDQYYARSQWDKTLRWVQKLQASNPEASQQVRAGYQRAMALYNLQRLPEAIKALAETRAVAEKLKSQEWLTRIDQLLSVCHLAGSDLAQAEASLQAAIEGLEGEQAIDARYKLASIKFTRGRWAEAQADYLAFLEATKGTSEDGDFRLREAQFRVAYCLLEQGQAKESEPLFSKLAVGDNEVSARALLWQSRIYSRDKTRKDGYADAAKVLAAATGRKWYRTGFRSRADGQPTTIVADIDFELANMLMLQSAPNWQEAIDLLKRVEARRPDYRHLPEALSQRAVCEHKLGQYVDSLGTSNRFLERFPDHALAGDVRFILAENAYMLRNRQEEAIKAYQQLLAKHPDHDKALAAQLRIAQIHRDQGQWEASNKLAVPLLAKAPQGELFSQLALLVGENYYRQSQWQQSAQALETFLADYVEKPTDQQKNGRVQKALNVDSALIQLGIAYTHLEKKHEAIGAFYLLSRFYRNDSPHYPLALVELGKLYYETGQFKPAREVLEAFLKATEDPDNALFQSLAAKDDIGRANYYLAWVHSSEERYDDAARHFGLAHENSSGRGRGLKGVLMGNDAVFQRGAALFNAGKYEEAAGHLSGVLSKQPTHTHRDLMNYYIGLAQARLENWGAAEKFFANVVENFPDAPFAENALYEWAWCARYLNNNSAAIERYNALLKRHPESPLKTKVQAELAGLNLDMGAQDAVIAKLTEAIKTANDPAVRFEMRYQLANAHFGKRDFETAAPMFEALIPDAAQSPLLPSILFQAGEARLALSETLAALEHFLAASQIREVPEPLSESIWMRLGETQNATGQFEAAASTYSQFTRRFPNSQWLRNARYGHGYALEKQEKYRDAISQYQKLLPQDGNEGQKLDKWMVQARYQIGECYFNEQQYDKAIAAFVSADTNSPGYPDWQSKAILEIARILIAQGKTEQAQERLKEVMTRFPRSKAASLAQQFLDEQRINR